VHANVIVDGVLVWTEVHDPEPARHELLVQVRAAGLNSADRLQVMGFYPAPPGSPPDIPGLELAGEVIEVGPDTTDFAIGDRVMAVVGGGGQAELCVVHERHALPVPDGIDWPAAGGFAEAFTTAHDALFTQCDLRAAERVCVHGAAGGVGSAAVQLAAAAGAEVVATVRNPALRDAVGALGAHHVIDPADLADAGPFDLILELVGAPNWPTNLDVLAPWGRVVVIGVGAGSRVEIDLLTVMQKRATVRGSTLRNRPLEEKGQAAQAVRRHVLPLLADGRLQVPVDTTFPMDHAPAAYDHFAAGGKLGKIVLTN
jgi:NADPH2:quinone reductase